MRQPVRESTWRGILMVGLFLTSVSVITLLVLAMSGAKLW